jgi:hypothetical protein
MMRRVATITTLVGLAISMNGAPASAATVTISAAGDISRADSSPTLPQHRTANLVSAFNPTAVLALGDLQYARTGQPAGAYQDFVDFYDKSWGAFKSKTLPVPGDEEYETPGAAGYFQYWSEAGRPGASPPGNYSVVLGDWLILAVNTNCRFVDCRAQKVWLKQQLQADTHTCELAFYHQTSNMWARTVMGNNHGEVVLAGHKHTYERWAPAAGVRRFTVGTGGKSLRAPDPAAEFGASAFGVLNMTLTATGYTWQFVSVDNQVLDSGSGKCVA